MSRWFRSYGFADVAPKLLVGAYPLDESDVRSLEMLGVRRVLNLVEDVEYARGARELVAGALARAGIEEQRLSLPDYGSLPAEALEQAVALVGGWLDQGDVTYVHCRAGWQRSVAVAAGVIAAREGIDVEAALELIGRRKAMADPLPHQREDLRAWWAARSHA